jgi:hypothetical protein
VWGREKGVSEGIKLSIARGNGRLPWIRGNHLHSIDRGSPPLGLGLPRASERERERGEGGRKASEGNVAIYCSAQWQISGETKERMRQMTELSYLLQRFPLYTCVQRVSDPWIK